MKLSLGFSPCPNDTFIFDAMIHQKVDTEGLEFDVLMADVEALNLKAFSKTLDITKLSYHAYAYLIKDYVLLDAGSALGNNCGPLLIAKKTIPLKDLSNAKIAIPGKYTTANFLLSLAFPLLKNRQEYLFSAIETAVANEEVDAGLIIHENRFTYAERGFVKIIDLGEYWENTTKMPIPLGGIVISRALDQALKEKVNRVLKRSVAYAFAHRESSKVFIKNHAQEMEADVIYKHIDLYVNDYSLDLGEKGRAAIQKLFEVAVAQKVIEKYDLSLFL